MELSSEMQRAVGLEHGHSSESERKRNRSSTAERIGSDRSHSHPIDPVLRGGRLAQAQTHSPFSTPAPRRHLLCPRAPTATLTHAEI